MRMKDMVENIRDNEDNTPEEVPRRVMYFLRKLKSSTGDVKEFFNVVGHYDHEEMMREAGKASRERERQQLQAGLRQINQEFVNLRSFVSKIKKIASSVLEEL